MLNFGLPGDKGGAFIRNGNAGEACEYQAAQHSDVRHRELLPGHVRLAAQHLVEIFHAGEGLVALTIAPLHTPFPLRAFVGLKGRAQTRRRMMEVKAYWIGKFRLGTLLHQLAKRYTEDGRVYLASLVEVSNDPGVWIKGYTDIFRTALMDDNRMCLCGIMAAEYDDLPDEVRVEVDGFTDLNVGWLSEVLSVSRPELDKDEQLNQALAIYAAVEGAQLISRGRGDIAV